MSSKTIHKLIGRRTHNTTLWDAEEQLRPKKKPKTQKPVIPSDEKVVCLYYLRGRCGRTLSNCKYAHPTGEDFKRCVGEPSSRANPEVRITVNIGDENAKGVCREHMLSRCGRRPESCKFAHPIRQEFVIMRAVFADE